ncbi:hypothetical protein ES708_15551 [subsurface metagenome]
MSNKAPKDVYFFGAGASSASCFKLPVMRGFLSEIDFNPNKYPNLYDFIKEHFYRTPLPELNLEQVITMLELSIDKFGSFGKRPEVYLYEAKREFDRYINNRLTIHPHQGCDKHKKILKTLLGNNPKNTIITLNYDLVIDNSLYELSPKQQGNQTQIEPGCLLDRMYSLLDKAKTWGGERPSLGQEHTNLGFYLKLHGSIDWLYCPTPDCGNHQLFFPNWIGSSEVHNKPGDLCSLCGSPLVSVIVPPTMHKSFENLPKLGLLWSLAHRELKQADKIIFIGISLAESDYYLSWLIKSALSDVREVKSIVVINKEKDESCLRAQELTGIKPDYIEGLDAFVKSFS